MDLEMEIACEPSDNTVEIKEDPIDTVSYYKSNCPVHNYHSAVKSSEWNDSSTSRDWLAVEPVVIVPRKEWADTESLFPLSGDGLEPQQDPVNTSPTVECISKRKAGTHRSTTLNNTDTSSTAITDGLIAITAVGTYSAPPINFKDTTQVSHISHANINNMSNPSPSHKRSHSIEGTNLMQANLNISGGKLHPISKPNLAKPQNDFAPVENSTTVITIKLCKEKNVVKQPVPNSTKQNLQNNDRNKMDDHHSGDVVKVSNIGIKNMCGTRNYTERQETKKRKCVPNFLVKKTNAPSITNVCAKRKYVRTSFDNREDQMKSKTAKLTCKSSNVTTTTIKTRNAANKGEKQNDQVDTCSLEGQSKTPQYKESIKYTKQKPCGTDCSAEITKDQVVIKKYTKQKSVCKVSAINYLMELTAQTVNLNYDVLSVVVDQTPEMREKWTYGGKGNLVLCFEKNKELCSETKEVHISTPCGTYRTLTILSDDVPTGGSTCRLTKNKRRTSKSKSQPLNRSSMWMKTPSPQYKTLLNKFFDCVKEVMNYNLRVLWVIHDKDPNRRQEYTYFGTTDMMLHFEKGTMMRSQKDLVNKHAFFADCDSTVQSDSSQGLCDQDRPAVLDPGSRFMRSRWGSMSVQKNVGVMVEDGTSQEKAIRKTKNFSAAKMRVLKGLKKLTSRALALNLGVFYTVKHTSRNSRPTYTYGGSKQFTEKFIEGKSLVSAENIRKALLKKRIEGSPP